VHDITFAPLRHLQAASAKHVQHWLILGQNIGFESGQASFPGKQREMSQEEAGNATPPVAFCR
jgi:hypothetical protein